MIGDRLSGDEAAQLLGKLGEDWVVVGRKLRREISFSTFAGNMRCVNKIAALAEAENHHPDLHIHYTTLVIELWTHSVGGLSVKDFQLASAIDRIVLSG